MKSLASPPAVVVEALEQYARELRRSFQDRVLSIRLFGSHARGEARADSDIDVAVVLDEIDWATQRDAIDLSTDIGLARDLDLSPILFDRATWERYRRHERAIALDIEREGIPF